MLSMGPLDKGVGWDPGVSRGGDEDGSEMIDRRRERKPRSDAPYVNVRYIARTSPRYTGTSTYLPSEGSQEDGA